MRCQRAWVCLLGSRRLPRQQTGRLALLLCPPPRTPCRCCLWLTADLPATAAELESLALDSNRFERLPPALASATALASLSLRSNGRLAVSQADAKTVLGRLPALREVHVWDCDFDREMLQRNLPRAAVNPLRPREQPPIPLAHDWPPFMMP